MDTTSVLVTLGGLALIVVVLWFFFGEKDDDYCEERLSQKEDDLPEYACPMHPWIISKDPAAVCSICGMKLVWRE